MSFANFVQAQLAEPLAVDGVSITLVQAEAPYQLPPVDGGVLVLTDSLGKPSFVEIIQYTARDGLVLSGVTRGAEGTTPRAWAAGTYCYQSLTAGEFGSVQAQVTEHVAADDPHPQYLTADEVPESFQVGDILVTARDPGPTFLPADGGVYLQSAYPELFSVIGLTQDMPDAAWAAVTSGFGTSNIIGVATDGAGTWIAAASTGEMSRSTDNGLTWTAVTSGAGTTGITGVATDGAGVCVVVGGSGAMTRSTDNGLTWAAVTSGFGTSNITGVATDGAGTWIATGVSGKMSRSTDNGLTWTAVTSGFGASHIYAAATDGAGTWIATGSTGAMTRSTDNGLTWAAVTSGFGTSNIRAVATDGAGVWVVVGDSGKMSRAYPYSYDIPTQFKLPQFDAPLHLSSYIKALEAA